MKPADKARELVGLIDELDLDIEDWEFLQMHSTGELLAKIENQLMKMDEKAEEARQEEAMYVSDPGYDWEMECKGDFIREGR